MKILITSSVEKSIKESAKLADKLGVGIEISRLPNAKAADEDFASIISSLKEQTAGFSGDITLHAMFSDLNPGSKDAALREVAKRRYMQSFEAAMAVGAKTVVFHSGHKGMKHRVSIENNQKSSVIFWSEFIKNFEDNGVTAVLENVLDFDPYNILTIVDAVNSPNLKICLDTGHANLCSDMPVMEWIKVYGKRLHHMHLHNNFKTNDDHAGLKYGTVNFLGIVDALKTEGVSPSVVFEIFDKAQMIESIETFNKILPA